MLYEDVEDGGQGNHLRNDVSLAVGMLYYFNGFLNEGVQLCMGCKYVSSPCFSLARFLGYDLLYHFFSVLSIARLNVKTFIIF